MKYIPKYRREVMEEREVYAKTMHSGLDVLGKGVDPNMSTALVNQMKTNIRAQAELEEINGEVEFWTGVNVGIFAGLAAFCGGYCVGALIKKAIVYFKKS